MKIIQIENLWKEYRLGVIGHGTLTHDLQSWWARVRGKDDPNARIVNRTKGHEKQVDGNHFWALQDINLEVNEGQIVGIIGRNGAGKSTLLKILSRVTTPSKGNIKIKGRIASLLEVGTGFHAELTGRENVFLNGAILGMSKREIRRKLDMIVDFSGVENFIDTPVKRYSSGMYVRLAFAVAAHLEPEILIIDEVLAVGDAQFQKKCLGKMEDVRKEGRTVLFVSHNMAAVHSLCNTGILLTAGKVDYNGSIADCICRYTNPVAGEDESGLQKKSSAKVSDIRIATENDEQLTAKSFLKISITLSTPYLLPNCYLNLHIDDSEGRSIVHTRTDHFNTYPSLDPGDHNIEIRFQRISLRAGIYSLWFRLYCNSKNVYELADSDKILLEVIGPQVGGFLDVPCQWFLDENPLTRDEMETM